MPAPVPGRPFPVLTSSLGRPAPAAGPAPAEGGRRGSGRRLRGRSGSGRYGRPALHDALGGTAAGEVGRNREVIMKRIAAPAVSLLRKLVGPEDPNSVWEDPPPKTAPMSDPFPVCRRMMRIMAIDTMMCRMIRIVCMVGSASFSE